MKLSRERVALVFVLAGLAGVTVVASADAATQAPAPAAPAPTPSASTTARSIIAPKLPVAPVIPLPSFKPANGKLTAISVPGGSFAEDEAQKIMATGSGGCTIELTLSNQSYGGQDEKTWTAGPLKLEPSSTMYNGTHFGTLAEGSYAAKAVGVKGCTGSAAIDFKVRPKTTVKKVSGQPTISFDQQPKNGGTTFIRTKDSNIWFKVAVPSSIKDEPNASCCDVEYNFKNEYGGWEALPNSPFSDPSWSGAVKDGSAVAFRSVSYFSEGREWRVRVRGSKYKTEFEWSEWLQFSVDQN